MLAVSVARPTQSAQKLFSSGQKLGRVGCGQRASQPGGEFSVCFNLKEKLLWPSGDAEEPRIGGRDGTLPGKHLRYRPELCSVPG